jgi:hypothetical protein
MELDEWSDPRPGRFTPGENSPRFPLHRRMGQLQSRSGRGNVETISLLWPRRESNPGRPAYTDWASSVPPPSRKWSVGEYHISYWMRGQSVRHLQLRCRLSVNFETYAWIFRKKDPEPNALRTNCEDTQEDSLSCFCTLFNWAPRHEGVLGEWRHSSTHSWPQH